MSVQINKRITIYADWPGHGYGRQPVSLEVEGSDDCFRRYTLTVRTGPRTGDTVSWRLDRTQLIALLALAVDPLRVGEVTEAVQKAVEEALAKAAQA
jgi:hypothetical protein